MKEQVNEKKARGRPQVRSDEETRALVVEAARQQFNEVGYALASMSAIARDAGVSTKTLYRLFPAKADLFADVVSDKIESYFLRRSDIPQHEDIKAGLEWLLLSYGRLALSRDTVLTTRLVLSESDRFPEIANVFNEKAVKRTTALMADWLRQQAASGSIAIDDPVEAAGMLRGMMVMEPQRAVMLRQAPCLGDEEIAIRARRCAAIFLNGCATSGV